MASEILHEKGKLLALLSSTLVAGLPLIAVADSIAYLADETISSNLVFTSGTTVDVAQDATVTAICGLNIAGTLTKTGAGAFELATVMPPGAINGNGAGGNAALAVSEGEFSIGADDDVQSIFSGGVTLSGTGSLSVKGGETLVNTAALGGRPVTVAGGKFHAKSVTGAASVTITGGEFGGTNTFTATSSASDVSRIDVAEGGTLALRGYTAAAGSDASIHIDGGTIRLIQYGSPDYSDRKWQNGTVYIGAKGMTLDVSGAYSWGAWWELPIRPEPEAENCVMDIVASASKPTRLKTGDIQLPGGIRVDGNVELMLCAETCPTTITLKDGARLRAVADVTIDKVVCEGEDQTFRLGVDDTENTVGTYTIKDFVPPAGKITFTWMRRDASSGPTVSSLNFSADILKFPATVNFNASRVLFGNNVTTRDWRLTERVENGWRIITFTVEPVGATTGLDPRSSSAWQSGTSAWEIGPWLYTHSGGSLTTMAPLMLTPAAKNRDSGISVPSGVTLTLAGGFSEKLGGFAKLGEGELALTGDKPYHLGFDFATGGSITATSQNAMFGDDGTNICPHYGQLVVGAGKLTVGSGSDSPYLAVRKGELDIGTSTTDTPGAEKDAEVVLKSGMLSVSDWTIIGRMHGNSNTCERLPIRSTITQNGGTALLDGGLILAHDGVHITTMDSRYILNGGECTIGDTTYIGSTGKGGGNNTALLQVNGGSLTCNKALVLQRYDQSDTLSATLELNGGTVTLNAGMSVNNATGTKTINLNGGELRLKGTVDGKSNAGTTFNWGGTVIKPVGTKYFSPLITGFETVNLSGEAVIDLSEMETSYSDAANNYASVDLNQSFTGTGPIVVTGSATNRMVRFGNGYTMPTAGVVAKSGGVVLNLGSLRTAKVLVKDGGAVSAYSTSASRYENLQLGETDDDRTAVYGYNYPYTIALPVVATNSLTVHGKVYVGFIEPNYGRITLPAVANEVLLAPKGSIAEIGLSLFELHPELVAKGCVATFSVDETDPTCDKLCVAVTYGTENSTWTAGTSGSWNVDSNWSVAPPAAGASVVFPDTLGDDITVSADETPNLIAIKQNSSHTVTLDGDVAFARTPNNGLAHVTYDVSNPDGVLELTGKTTFGGAVYSDLRTSGAGTLRVSGKLVGEPSISITSGRIEGTPAALGSAKINLSNASVRFTDNGVFKGQLLHIADDENGLGVDVADGKTVYATGLLNNKTALVKYGGGTIVFAHDGANSYTGKRNKNATAATYSIPQNGDISNTTGFSLYSGTVVLDGGEDSTYSSGAIETWIGYHPITDSTGEGAYDAHLVVRSGTFSSGSYLAIVRTVSAACDGPVQLGYVRRPRAVVDVFGTLTTKSIIMNYGNYKNANCHHAELNVYSGGSLILTANGDAGRFAIGHEGTNSRLEEGGNEAVVNLYEGGLIDKRGDQDVRVGFHNGSKNATYPARGIINIYGGVFRTAATAGIDLSFYNAHGTLNLYGGTLESGCIKRSNNDGYYSAQADVHFDGGTFKPTLSERSLGNLTTFTVGEGGAKFDLGETNTLTLAQTLTTAAGVEADGGIALTATATNAVLALTAANAFNGPLTVNGGTMLPTVAAAASCATGVVVNAGGVFDANGLDFTFAYLKGNGGIYTNGTVTVTGEVVPGELGLYVQDIAFGSGATLKSAVGGNAGDGWTAPCLNVSGSATANGGVTLDLGGTEDAPLPRGARVKVAEVVGGGAFPAVCATGVCDGTSTFRVSRTVNGDGATEVWAEVVPLGTVFHMR